MAQTLDDYISNINKPQIVAKNNVYADIDASFKKNVFTGDVYLKKDIEAIKNSVKNIILTGNYERPFQPEFGGGITNFLFENLDEPTLYVAEYKLSTAIELYEPRVIVESISFAEDTLDKNAIAITVIIRIKDTNRTADVSAVLQRIR